MASPSALPARAPGTRARAGNAMARTRAATLRGAALAVARTGARKLTMNAVAELGGIAKGTVYNHFRDKDDVLAALLQAEVAALADECARVATDEGLAAALERAAQRLAAHPALRKVAADEPELLAGLLTPTTSSAWAETRAQVAAVLAAAGRVTTPGAVELVLRWVLGAVAAPAAADTVAESAQLLDRAVPLAQF